MLAIAGILAAVGSSKQLQQRQQGSNIRKLSTAGISSSGVSNNSSVVTDIAKSTGT